MRRIRKQSGGLFSRRTRKHGGTKRRVWRKIHIGIDEKTLEIRAAELTTSDVGDVEPASATGSSEPARDVARASRPDPTRSGNRQRHCRRCLRHPPRAMKPSPHAGPQPSSSRARTPSRGSPTLPARSRATRPCVHPNASAGRSGDDGEGPARHWSEGGLERYHRRSRVETKMHCVKLPGQRLAARDFDRQVAEFQVRVIRGLSRTDGVRPLIPERLHRPWHTRHRGRGISLSGDRGRPAIRRFVQQSPFRWPFYAAEHFEGNEYAS